MMPFTYSIANGLAFGFISYALIKLMTGRASQVHPATWLVAGLFLIRFAFFSPVSRDRDRRPDRLKPSGARR